MISHLLKVHVVDHTFNLFVIMLGGVVFEHKYIDKSGIFITIIQG